MLVLEEVLLKTIQRLSSKSNYQWTHQGNCNCGHVIQSVTGMSPGKIHNIALTGPGEWVDHAKKYCKTSGLPVDDLISKLLTIGIKIDDIAHLELLSDPNIIRYIPNSVKPLSYKKKEDLIYYLKTWKSILSAKRMLITDNSKNVFINGIPYQQNFKSELLLDENPSSGVAA